MAMGRAFFGDNISCIFCIHIKIDKSLMRYTCERGV